MIHTHDETCPATCGWASNSPVQPVPETAETRCRVCLWDDDGSVILCPVHGEGLRALIDAAEKAVIVLLQTARPATLDYVDSTVTELRAALALVKEKQ